MAAPNMRELGSTGLKRSGGVVQEEFLRELYGARWWRTVREMQQDAIITAALLAIELSLRQVKIDVEPADDTPAAADVAEFVDGCFDDMSSSWADTLSEILTMLPYGYSYMETVYKRRMGDNKDAGKRSNYTDGRIGWRKWSIRAQDSLDEWQFDDNGGLQGFWQYTDGGRVLIPIEKALLFRTRANKGNPEGYSLLRGAYVAWYYKRNISRIEAVGIERDLAGLPVAYIPDVYMSSAATSEQQALYAAIKEIITNIRRDEQEGVVFPLVYDDNGHKLFELTLLSTGGQRQFDTDAIIARYNQQMAMSVLADFIMLGHEQVGSYALSATKSSLFRTALEAWLNAIADVINTHAVPRLLRLNGMAMELAPRVKFGRVGEIELADITEFVKAASGAGMTLFPGMELENHLRGVVGFPLIDEEEFQAREDERKANQEADRQAKAKQPVNVPPGDEDAGDEEADSEEQMSASQRAVVLAAERILARGA